MLWCDSQQRWKNNTSLDFFIVNLRDTNWKKSVVCSSRTIKPTLPRLSPKPFNELENIIQMCKQGPNVPKNKHRILVKDLISYNFLHANDKKQDWSCKQCKEYILFYSIFKKATAFLEQIRSLYHPDEEGQCLSKYWIKVIYSLQCLKSLALSHLKMQCMFFSS